MISRRTLAFVTKTLDKIKLRIDKLSSGSLSNRAFLNTISSVLDYGTRLSVGFFVNPYMVSGLGDYLYGSWQIMLRLIGYSSTATNHPAQALKWTIAKSQSSNDFSMKRRSIGSAIGVWLIFLPFLIVVGGTFSWFLPTLLKAPTHLIASIRLASGLILANVILTNLTDIPRSTLYGENLDYKRMGVSALLLILGGFLIIGALYYKFGVVGVAAASIISSVAVGIFFLYVARSNIQWFGIEKPSNAEVKDFLTISWWFMGWQFVNQLMVSSDLVVLGLLISPEYVTIYTLTKYVPEIAINFIAVLSAGMLPGLGRIVGARDFEKAARLRGELLSMIWLVATAAGITSLVWNRSFLNLWVGEHYFAGIIPLIFIIAKIIQFAIIQGDAYIIDLTLNLRQKVLLGLLSIIVSIVLSILLVRWLHMGIIGLCIGYISGFSILSWGYPRIVTRILGLSMVSQFFNLLRPLLVTISLGLISIWLANKLQIDHWMELGILAIATFLCVSAFAFFLGLNQFQRMAIRNRLWQIIPFNN